MRAPGKCCSNSRMLRTSAPRQRVDGLVVVADHAHVARARWRARAACAAARRWCPGTRRSGCSESAAATWSRTRSCCLEEAHGQDHQIVEVDRVHVAQRCLVLRVELARDRVVLEVALGDLLGLLELVLPQRDARQDGAGVELASAVDGADARASAGAAGPARRPDRRSRSGRRSRAAVFFLQEAHAEAVERRQARAAWRPCRPTSGHHALAHLVGGLVGEADRQDLLGTHAARRASGRCAS